MQKKISYHQHLLAFPVLVVPVRRLSADAFELLLDDGLQHGISGTWTPCEDNKGTTVIGMLCYNPPTYLYIKGQSLKLKY